MSSTEAFGAMRRAVHAVVAELQPFQREIQELHNGDHDRADQLWCVGQRLLQAWDDFELKCAAAGAGAEPRFGPHCRAWKYHLHLVGEQLLKMPAGAWILSVAHQPVVGLCVWALVDPEAELVTRRIYIRGTGHALAGAAAAEYVGTVVEPDGKLVWHVWAGADDE